MQLDHVLSRGLTVVDSGQVALNGTDHAAVWASYALPAAPTRVGIAAAGRSVRGGVRSPGALDLDVARVAALDGPAGVRARPRGVGAVRDEPGRRRPMSRSTPSRVLPRPMLARTAVAGRSPHGSSSSSSTSRWAQNLPSRTPMPCSTESTCETSEESQPVDGEGDDADAVVVVAEERQDLDAGHGSSRPARRRIEQPGLVLLDDLAVPA